MEGDEAIDVSPFASQSETQGMVLNEAMAAGTPVVGVDAPGVRDIVSDKVNGRLVPNENEEEFSKALNWVFDRSPSDRKKLIEGAKETAKKYSVERSAIKALEVYESLKVAESVRRKAHKNGPLSFFRHLSAEWHLFSNFTKATMSAFR